jgi:hypothetical protein
MARQASPEVAGQTRLLIFLAISAAVLAIAVPPVGMAFGVGTLVVLALRRRRAMALPRPAIVLATTAGVFAVVVGGLLSLVLAVLGGEMADLRECLTGANTRVAERVCQDDFADAVQDRVFG